MRSLALLVLLAGPVAAEDGVQLRAIASGQVTLTGDADATVTPSADVEVDGPIALGKSAPLRILARLRILGQPGQTVEFSDVATFRAARLDLGAYRRIGELQIGDQVVWTSVLAECGFSSVISQEPEPLDRYGRYCGGGFRLEQRNGGPRLSVVLRPPLFGQDTRLGIDGLVPLRTARGIFALGGDALLSLGAARYGRTAVVFRLQVGVDLSRLYRLLGGP